MLQAVVEGLAYGGLYALLGIGFFLTYGVLRRIDLAYGTVVMTSVYLAAMIAASMKLPWPVAILLTFSIGLPLSLMIAVIAFVLVRQDARFSMAATLGIWMVLEELILHSPGRGRGQPVTNPFHTAMLEIGDIQLRVDQILILVLALALAGLVTVCLTHSRVGRAIRVASYDADVAALLGIARIRTLTLATLISAGIGSLAGWSFAMTQSGIDLHFGMWATVKGLVILALGGTRHIGFIVTAALGLGMAERVGSEVIGAGYRDLVGYGVILILLATEAFVRSGERNLVQS